MTIQDSDTPEISDGPASSPTSSPHQGQTFPFHFHWADPNNDIIFVSSQNVGYRTSSWLLAKHSNFFRRVRQESPTFSQPIKVDLKNSLLEALLLKLVLPPQTENEDTILEISSPRLEDKIRLRAFFKTFEFKESLEAIEQVLLEHTQRSFWPVLRGAAFFNDLSLGMLVIGGMNLEHLEREDFWQQVYAIRPAWQTPFILAVVCRQTAPSNGGLHFKTDTKEMAEDFKNLIQAGLGNVKMLTIGERRVKVEIAAKFSRGEASEEEEDVNEEVDESNRCKRIEMRAEEEEDVEL